MFNLGLNPAYVFWTCPIIAYILEKNFKYLQWNIGANSSKVRSEDSRMTSTHFMPLVSFYTPWKHQKTIGFPMFPGDIERPVAGNGLISSWGLYLLCTEFTQSLLWRIYF